MEIIVLLKQVPSTESFVGVGDDGKSVKTDEVKWVINPYDEFAVEEALRIRDDQGGAVTILSVGKDKATEAIRTALAMGADKGILVNDPAAEDCDAMGTATILSAVLKDLEYDVIIAGMRAVDDDNYLVGTAVAELLDIPNISMIVSQEIADGNIKCERTVDGGTAVIEAQLPVLLTTQRGLNEPRYASLPGIMKAKKKPIDVKTLSDLGLDAAAVNQPQLTVVGLSTPPERGGGTMIEGETAQAKAEALVKALHEEAKVI